MSSFRSRMKSKRGIAAMWAIVFCVIMTCLVSLLCTLILSSSVNNRILKDEIAATDDLHQIGEYYLRCISNNGDFPTGAESNFNSFSWLDNSAKDFFAHCKEKYGFTYLSEHKLLNEFDSDFGKIPESYMRKLTVKDSSGRVVMCFVLKESVTYDTVSGKKVWKKNPVSNYTILEWSISDNITGIDEQSSPGFFKRLWQDIIGTISGVIIRPTQYTLNFDPAGGSGIEGFQKIDRGSAYVLPNSSTMKKAGAEFTYWTKNGESSETHYTGSYTPVANASFTAHWRDYVVTFDAGEGNCSTTSLTGIVTLPPATRSHYDFLGWTETTGENAPVVGKDGKYTPTRDITLHAKWLEKGKCAINYARGDADEDCVIPEKQYKYSDDENVTLSGVMLRKTVVTDSDITVSFDENGGKSTVDSKKFNKKLTQIYMSSGWKDGNGKEYSLSGSYSGNDSITLKPLFKDHSDTVVLTGKFPSAPEAPDSTREFVCWRIGEIDFNAESDIKETPISDTYAFKDKITAKAIWTVKTYTVTVETENTSYGMLKDEDNQETSSTNIYNVPHGSTISKDENEIVISGEDFEKRITILPKTHYQVKGFEAVTVTGNKTFTVEYEAEEYNISFVGGGSLPDDTKYSYSGSKQTKSITVPARKGYNFTGWTVSGGSTSMSSDNKTLTINGGSTGNIILTAKWSAIDYKITLDQNSGTGGKLAKGTYNISNSAQTVTVTKPTRSGYRFTGWTISGDGSASMSSDNGTLTINANTIGDIKLTAKWAQEYTVSYSGSGTNPSSFKYIKKSSAQTFTLEESTRTGYTFKGWKVSGGTASVSGSTLTINANTAVNITLTSDWSAIDYTITLKQNGGSGGDLNKTKYNISGSNQTVTITNPTKTGYNFNGWTVSGGNTSVSGTTLTITANSTGNITLTANWTPKTYDITVDKDGGSGGTSNTTYSYSESSQTKTLSAPTKTGYTFKGWTVSGGSASVSGNTLTINAKSTSAIAIKANWTLTEYTITMNQDGGSGGGLSKYTYKMSGSAQTVTITLPSNGSKSFDGWDISGNSSASVSSNYKTLTIPANSTGNITITANWSSACFAPGTLITMADGSQKPVELVRLDEKVLAFNHETGVFEETDILVYVKSKTASYEKCILNFSDTSFIEIINRHGLFDYTTKKYVEIGGFNAKDFVGHDFAVYDSVSEKYRTVKLTGYNIVSEITTPYSVISQRNINVIANGLLTVSDEIQGLYNFFDYGDDLKYVKADMDAKLKEYGVSDYSQWSEWFTFDQYRGFLLDYTNVAFGVGLTTKEQHIKTFLNYYNSVCIF